MSAVQQSTTVELIVNLKTAKTLGFTILLMLLGRADEVGGHVCSWHIASFRCDAESGRYRDIADIGQARTN